MISKVAQWIASSKFKSQDIIDDFTYVQNVVTDIETKVSTNYYMGEQGIQGIKGDTGLTGADGESAYSIALSNGFVGTEIEWIASLKGEQGIQGIQGVQGIQGETGLTGATGTTSFIGLTDAPQTFVGQSGKIPQVKTDETGLEFVSKPQGGISFYIAGDVAIGTSKVAFICPTALTIIKVIAKVTTAPTGAALIVDIHKNGTTVFTTQANRPTIAISGTSVTSVAPDVIALTEGDLVSLDVDQIGSTVAGANLAVLVEVQLA